MFIYIIADTNSLHILLHCNLNQVKLFMFDSYQKGNRVCVYRVTVYGWSESSCNTNFDNDEVSGFFFSVLKNRNLILARPGALRHNHVSYASLKFGH